MSNKVVLSASDIVAGYTDLDVLKEVSVRVRKGEIVSIIGPNGAGKSTLLKAIFGILKPRKGKVRLNGNDITGSEPHEIVRKGMSYVPQLDNVFPTLTVEENLEMGGILQEHLSERMEEIFDLFPSLKKRKNDRVSTLSGGQQKMVAFGRGLMLNPDVLLLDEPSAGLAPQIAAGVYEKIEKINQTGTAIVIVEQNARQALRMSDYGYVLEDGKNRFQGRGMDLLGNDNVVKLYLGG